MVYLDALAIVNASIDEMLINDFWGLRFRIRLFPIVKARTSDGDTKEQYKTDPLHSNYVFSRISYVSSKRCL